MLFGKEQIAKLEARPAQLSLHNQSSYPQWKRATIRRM